MRDLLRVVAVTLVLGSQGAASGDAGLPAALSDARPLVGRLPLKLGGTREAALSKLLACRETVAATWCHLVRKQEGMLVGLEGSAWLTFRRRRLVEVSLPIRPGHRQQVIQALVARYGPSDAGFAYRRAEGHIELDVAADEVRYNMLDGQGALEP
jgi:hypothetical protein